MKFWKFYSVLAAWVLPPSFAIATTTHGVVEPVPILQQVRIEKLSRSILAFDIANGSDLAAAALSDLSVRVWKLHSGQLIHQLSFPEPATDQNLKLVNEVEPISLHFSPDGKTLAVGILNAIHIYSVESWEESATLAVAGEGETRLGLTATLQRPELKPRTTHEAQAQSKQPILDANERMRKWAEERRQGDGRTRISDFKFSNDGMFILASYCRGACWVWPGVRRDLFPSGSDPVRLWNVLSQNMTWERLYDATQVISRVVPLAGGKLFIAVNAQLGHCAVGGFNISTGQQVWSHTLGPCDQPLSIVGLPDGQSYITNRIEEASRTSKVWEHAALYEALSGEKVGDLPDSDGTSVADISSDGNWLVSLIWKGTQFEVWNLREKKIVSKGLPKKWNRTADCILNRVRVSPSNHWLVIGCDERGDLAVYRWGAD